MKKSPNIEKIYQFCMDEHQYCLEKYQERYINHADMTEWYAGKANAYATIARLCELIKKGG